MNKRSLKEARLIITLSEYGIKKVLSLLSRVGQGHNYYFVQNLKGRSLFDIDL